MIKLIPIFILAFLLYVAYQFGKYIGKRNKMKEIQKALPSESLMTELMIQLALSDKKEKEFIEFNSTLNLWRK